MLYTDTHCHLDMHQYDDDRDAVIQRAIDGGIVRMLIPGIDLPSSRAAIKLADKYTEVYAAVGVHPNYAKGWTSDTQNQLGEMCEHPKVVAVGEIGLDYYREFTPHDKQQKIFQSQLEVAFQKMLPVVIHVREAMMDVIGMISKWYDKLIANGSPLIARAGVLHSYSGTVEELEQTAKLGFYFGATGPITFKNEEEMRNVFDKIDSNKILIETDSPYLSPQPMRGKRNEPINVTHIAQKLATIRAEKLVDMVTITYDNSGKLFQW